MKRMYISRDRHRGLHGTLLWTISEVGELTGAALKKDRNAMRSEAADVLAWLCSTCNLIGIDLEDAAFEKYGGGCPKCRHIPCRCREK
jgi:NTP pyrophosphatase (non-canonical NTP hydrolase)